MKSWQKFLILILIIGLLFGWFIWTVNKIPDGYKKVEIEEKGVLVVPSDWIMTIYENQLYFTDKPMNENGYKIYLMELKEIENRSKTFTNGILGDIQYEDSIKNGGVSGGGCRYGINEYLYQEETIKKFCFESNDLYLISWDDSVSEETMKIMGEYSLDLANWK